MDSPAAFFVLRARLVGSAALVGFVLGVGVLFVLVITSSTVVRASEFVFALGSLAFAFGLLGWSGSALAGSGIETMQEYMETGSNWTEANSRRAMARIIGFGLGGMMGAVVGTVLVG